MKNFTLAGVALIVIGVLALAYQGISYTETKQVIDLGPIKATTRENKTIPLPPIVGALAIAGGIALLVAGGRK